MMGSNQAYGIFYGIVSFAIIYQIYYRYQTERKLTSKKQRIFFLGLAFSICKFEAWKLLTYYAIVQSFYYIVSDVVYIPTLYFYHLFQLYTIYYFICKSFSNQEEKKDQQNRWYCILHPYIWNSHYSIYTSFYLIFIYFTSVSLLILVLHIMKNDTNFCQGKWVKREDLAWCRNRDRMSQYHRSNI